MDSSRRLVASAARGIAAAWLWLARTDAAWREKRNTAPWPVYRWALGIGILVWTATGSAPRSAGAWFTAHLPWLIVAATLTVGPEIVRIEIGGMKMELLREARSEIRALSAQVANLQVQQAAATSQAASVVNNYYDSAKNAASVIKEAGEGEEAKAVPASEIDWREFIRPSRQRTFGHPSVPSPSPEPGSESTVRE